MKLVHEGQAVEGSNQAGTHIWGHRMAPGGVPMAAPVVAMAPPPQPVAPTLITIDAGPLWNQADASAKCPSLCASRGRWNGQWWTTVQGQNSVCQCEVAAAAPQMEAPPPMVAQPPPMVVEPEHEHRRHLIMTDKRVYHAGEPIIVRYHGMPGAGTDWTNVTKATDAPNEWGNWEYTNGTSEGTRTVQNLAPGEYEARAYFSNGTDLQDRAAFTVVP